MKTGLLWFDNTDGKPLAKKLKEAVAAYRAKPRFDGRKPDTCYGHPSVLPHDREVEVDGIRVVPSANVIPHHFLIGSADGGSGEEAGRGRPREDTARQRKSKRGSRRKQTP